MPQSTVEQDDPYKLPQDTFLPARLIHVEEKRIEFTLKKDRGGKRAGEKDTLVKWIWEFEIAQGEYAGLHAWGETDPKISVFPSGERNVPAQWIEALRELEVSFGEGVNTDDYDGLPCVITVAHHSRPRGDGQGMFYSTPVKDVFPASLLSEMANAGQVQSEEPPF